MNKYFIWGAEPLWHFDSRTLAMKIHFAGTKSAFIFKFYWFIFLLCSSRSFLACFRFYGVQGGKVGKTFFDTLKETPERILQKLPPLAVFTAAFSAFSNISSFLSITRVVANNKE